MYLIHNKIFKPITQFKKKQKKTNYSYRLKHKERFTLGIYIRDLSVNIFVKLYHINHTFIKNSVDYITSFFGWRRYESQENHFLMK